MISTTFYFEGNELNAELLHTVVNEESDSEYQIGFLVDYGHCTREVTIYTQDVAFVQYHRSIDNPDERLQHMVDKFGDDLQERLEESY